MSLKRSAVLANNDLDTTKKNRFKSGPCLKDVGVVLILCCLSNKPDRELLLAGCTLHHGPKP